MNSWLATFLGRSFGMDLASSATRLGPGLFFIALSAGRLLGSLVLNFLDARRFFRLSALMGLAGLGLLFVGNRSAALSGIALRARVREHLAARLRPRPSSGGPSAAGALVRA